MYTQGGSSRGQEDKARLRDAGKESSWTELNLVEKALAEECMRIEQDC